MDKKPKPTPIPDHPGPRFKELREDREMTLQDVCDAMAKRDEEMNTGNLSRFERRLEDFSVQRMRKLAQVYGVYWGDVCSSLPMTGIVIARAYGTLPPSVRAGVDQAFIRAQLEAAGKSEGHVHVRHTGAAGSDSPSVEEPKPLPKRAHRGKPQ